MLMDPPSTPHNKSLALCPCPQNQTVHLLHLVQCPQWPHWLKTIALDVSGLMSEGLLAYLSAQPFPCVGSRLLIVSFWSLSGFALKNR